MKVSNLSNSQKLFLLAIGLVLIYWGVGRFHSYYCAPHGLWGLLQTPFLMGSPFCSASLQILSKATELYSAIWMLTVGTLFGFLYSIFEQFKASNKSMNDQQD